MTTPTQKLSTSEALAIFVTFEPKDVESVYASRKGKAFGCHCGCRGAHFHASHSAWAREPGISPAVINDRRVAQVIAEFRAALESGEAERIELDRFGHAGCIALEVDGKELCVYSPSLAEGKEIPHAGESELNSAAREMRA